MRRHSDAEQLKQGLTRAFRTLRGKRHNLAARVNFSCCQGCGCSEIDVDGRDGYVFYHRQGAAKLREQGYVHLYYGAVDSSGRTVQDGPGFEVGRQIADVLREQGLAVYWNGCSDNALRVTVPAGASKATRNELLARYYDWLNRSTLADRTVKRHWTRAQDLSESELRTAIQKVEART